MCICFMHVTQGCDAINSNSRGSRGAAVMSARLGRDTVAFFHSSCQIAAELSLCAQSEQRVREEFLCGRAALLLLR